MQRFGRIISMMGRHWAALSVVVALTASMPLITALQPWPVKLLIDYALDSSHAPPTWLTDAGHFLWGGNWTDPSPSTLVILAASGSLALFLLGSLLETARHWIWERTAQRMIYDLAARIFARLQRLSLRYHTRIGVGDSLSRITTDSWCIYTLAESLLFSPVQNVLTLLTVGAIAWSLDPVLAGVSLIAAPALAAVTFAFGPRLRKRARAQREVESHLIGFVHQTLSSIPLAQMFDAGDRNTRRYQSVAGDAIALSQQGVILRNAFALASGLLMTLGMAIVLYVGAQRVLAGALSVGSLLVFVAYLRSINGAANGLLQTWVALKTAGVSVDRVLEVLDCRDEVRSPVHPLKLADQSGSVRRASDDAKCEIAVSFDSVTFGYEPDRPVLLDVSLDLYPNQTLAVVGKTGAGKSTLASLVPRLFDPWSGAVRFNGIDVRELDLSEVRGAVAMVLQEPLLLPRSVAENISYGLAGAPGPDTRNQVIAAAIAADADGFIRQLPQGYDTIIGQRGATLSGGQKQRIAIARAFFKDAPILILDEPTSALDGESESAVLKALDRLRRGRTVILIAHRLSTARHAERVAIIENGRIARLRDASLLSEEGGFFRALEAALPRETAS